MTLNRFSVCGMRQAAFLAVLLGSFSVASVSAVELVGKPVPLSSSSVSADLSLPDVQEQEKPKWEEPLDSANVAAPIAAQPFGINKHFDADGDNTLVQLMAMVFCIGGPILLIIVLVSMHYRAKERREKNINANIERLLAAGRDIPIELLRGDEPYVGPDSALARDDIQLQKGIKNLCLGVGLVVSLSIIFGFQFGAIGFIVLSVGASQLWLWKLSGSKKDKIENQA